MENCTDLNLGEVVYTSIIYHMPHSFLHRFIEWLRHIFWLACWVQSNPIAGISVLWRWPGMLTDVNSLLSLDPQTRARIVTVNLLKNVLHKVSTVRTVLQASPSALHVFQVKNHCHWLLFRLLIKPWNRNDSVMLISKWQIYKISSFQFGLSLSILPVSDHFLVHKGWSVASQLTVVYWSRYSRRCLSYFCWFIL